MQCLRLISEEQREGCRLLGSVKVRGGGRGRDGCSVGWVVQCLWLIFEEKGNGCMLLGRANVR